MLGGNHVVQKVPVSEIDFLDAGIIRNAIVNGDPLIQMLVTQFLKLVLEILQAFMGHP